VRGPLEPGRLTQAHAALETRCEECHVRGAGAVSARCQRCHEASRAGRLTHAALACARCHVEHRGRTALTSVDPAHCLACHFRRFDEHPEFAARITPVAEAPGLKFPHERHVREYGKRGVGAGQSCVKCHEPRGRDLAKLDFERHCASCHAAEGSVGIVEPIPLEDALPPGPAGEGFEVADGRVGKAVVAHRDPWVRGSLARLSEELEREAGADRRARKLESAEILATSCQRCHEIRGATLEPPVLAQRRLVRAGFQHEPHLQLAECLTCHAEVAASRSAEDRSLPGVQSCRECHRPQGAPAACLSCHQFHPRERP
jgi:hypothetical protein